MLLHKHHGQSCELLPWDPSSAFPSISKVSDVPTGSDIKSYTGTLPIAITMPGGRSGIRLRIRLRLPCSVGQLKRSRPFFDSLNLKGKRVFMNPVTCKATDLIRIGYCYKWNPELTNRRSYATSPLKRNLRTIRYGRMLRGTSLTSPPDTLLIAARAPLSNAASSNYNSVGYRLAPVSTTLVLLNMAPVVPAARRQRPIVTYLRVLQP